MQYLTLDPRAKERDSRLKRWGNNLPRRRNGTPGFRGAPHRLNRKVKLLETNGHSPQLCGRGQGGVGIDLESYRIMPPENCLHECRPYPSERIEDERIAFLVG